MLNNCSIVWYYAEKNSYLNEVKKVKTHDDKAEDIRIVDVMAYDQELDSGEYDCKCIVTSYEAVSRAFAYLSELMIDLRVSDEYAHQIIIAVIRLISK